MAWTASSTQFIRDILRGIGAPVTQANMLALRAWQQAEGGSARWNPFNSTQPASGAGSYNSVGVRNYTSYQQGLQATLETLRNGHYGSILSALHQGANPYAVASAVGSSPWGTSGSLMASVLHGYGGNYTPVAGTPVPHGQVTSPGAVARATPSPFAASQQAGRMAAQLALSQIHPVTFNLPTLNLPTPQASLAKALPTPQAALSTPVISDSPFKAESDQGASQLAAMRRSLSR